MADLPDPYAGFPAAAEDAEDPALQALAAVSARLIARARGAGTLRAYRSAWTQYVAWCAGLGRAPLAGEPRTVSMYLVAAAQTRAVATLRVHLAAIVTAHRLAGVALDPRHPRIALVLEGLARDRAGRPPRQAPPLGTDDLARLLAVQPEGPLGLRNRALLLLGFGGALRRSELVALRIGDVRAVPGRGVELSIRRSKTDPLGKGAAVAIWAAADPALCALRATEAWSGLRSRVDPADPEAPFFCGLTRGGRLTGRVLSDKAVVRLIKDAAHAAGLPDAARFSGHSLRAGLATAAAETEAQLHDIMRQTRHRSPETARRYMRSRDLWTANVTERLFRPRTPPEA